MGADVASLLASLPAGPWRAAALAWAERFGEDLGAAWSDCPRGSWLLWLAGRAGIEETYLILAAADCARVALELAPAVAGSLGPALGRMVAWCRQEATPDDLANAVAHAVGLASRLSMQAKGAAGEERRRLLTLSLAARAVARVGEGRGDRTRPQTWPTSADLTAAAAAAAAPREREDAARAITEARCAQLVRARVPLGIVVRRLIAPAGGPCYVEVCVTDELRWQALCEVWYEAGRAKDADRLDGDDPAFSEALVATGDNAAEARNALDSLRGGAYALGPPRRLDDFTGRLELVPQVRPCGGLGPITWLCEAFGLAVVAYDDGAGRREGAPEE